MASRIFLTLCLLAGSAWFAQAQTTALKPESKPETKPAPAPAPIKIGGLTVSGSLRLRLESWNWFESDAANSEYNFGAAQLRLAIGQQKEHVEWQVEGVFPLLLNLPNDAIAPAPQGQLGLGAAYFAANGRRDGSAILRQAYVRFKGIGGDKASSLRIGRFEFADGTEVTPADPALAIVKRDHIAHRLIGPFSFTHVGRGFDGAQFVRNARSGNFTLVAARPTEGVFQLRGNQELDVDFYYGAFTRPLKTKRGESEFRAFALHYHDGRRVLKTDNRPQAARAADGENIRLTPIGSPSSLIVGKADEWKPDVIVIGSHGRTALGRFFFGSVSQQVLHEAHASVRIARGRSVEAGAPVRLVVGVDGSKHANAAVAAVAARAWPKGTEVRLVNGMWKIPAATSNHMLGEIAAWVARENARVKEAMDAAFATLKAAGLKASVVLKDDEPRQLLVREAESWEADSIFVGSKGMGRVERFLIGSVSSAVASRAHCSVEVVRAA